ncbi:hypothetical protein BD410DRAFT_838200 [Rickenella mellea]|uniref:Calycin-like protein n=1 Tax=Rickenella mellea TaxID=50990 RepID=A0A4Y7QA83_9AGAM|nr:hypothetical protein BD410DRAFT_838200 [Rickenella mellea]
MDSNIVIHAPDSDGLDAFDLDAFTGKWHVTHSTLPLWKNKKNVTITYTPIPPTTTTGNPGPPTEPRKFHDLVEYLPKSASSSPDTKPTRIEGIDTVLGPSGARFKWRGKGWLVVASSKWQVIAHGDGWAVTYFEKTLFTPAGLDIYSRDGRGLEDAFVEELVAKVRGVGGGVGRLAEAFFKVELEEGGE